MAWGFERGRLYNRTDDIHARFSGQPQGGIITPAKHALVIAITGDIGTKLGYADRQRDDGVFEYYGQGLVGDMSLKGPNGALLAHTENGEDLLLFKTVGKGLRFEGVYVCEGYHISRAPDINEDMRDAIVFELRPLEAVNEEVEATTPVSDLSLDELRKRALAASTSSPERRPIAGSVFERSRYVRDYTLARAKGHCQDCGMPAPFVTQQGVPYLEAHHIKRLTDGGPDAPRFTIALCPNCHRRAHHGTDREACAKRYLEIVGDADAKV